MSRYRRFVLTLGVSGTIVGIMFALMLLQVSPALVAGGMGIFIACMWMLGTSEFVRMATGTEPENIAYRKTTLYLWIGCLQVMVAFMCFIPFVFTLGKMNSHTYKDGIEFMLGPDAILTTATVVTVMWVAFGGILSMALGSIFSLSFVRKVVFYTQIVVCLEVLCAFLAT